MTERLNIVITSDRYGVDEAAMTRERELLKQYPNLDVHLSGVPAMTEEDLIRIGQDADALLISTREAVTRNVVSQIPRVKVISRYGVGLDNVDLDAAAEYGIVVTHYPQYCTAEVADHAMSMLLTLNRRIVEQNTALHQGAWNQHRANTTSIQGGPVPALRDLTLGIIGFGRIGHFVAARAKPFGLRLISHDPYQSAQEIVDSGVTPVSLEELMAESDLITIHCPLTPETRGSINAERLRLMKPYSAIVNTARGPIIDLDALATFLVERPDVRAALDVVDPEPLPAPSPLYTLPNVILTPHSAYYSTRSVELVRNGTFVSALDVLSGVAPETVANPAVLEHVTLKPRS